MKAELALALGKLQYPSGIFPDTGENLRILTRDESAYTPSLRKAAGALASCAIIVPTNRSTRITRKNIERVMQMNSGPVVFLCSGEAKKEAIADIAKSYPNQPWIAIDGPFPHDGYAQDYETMYTSIAYGNNQSDISLKKNFALLLARLMGWKAVFFLDDDVLITKAHFLKAVDLLYQDKVAVVGFSARFFPDHSVAVHARRLAKGPIDSFIGGGAMAVRTDKPILSFFPYVYNEDWLFLLVYCLLGGGDVVWAGMIRQHSHNPFSDTLRAKNEEPGDILGESLVRLAMSLRADLRSDLAFEKLMLELVKVADKAFWENEINTRVSFISDTRAALKQRKLPSWRRHQALRALDSSLERLIGKNGQNGLRAEEFVHWVQAWVRDLGQWHKAKLPTTRCQTLPEAMKFLNLTNNYVFEQGSASTARSDANHEAATKLKLQVARVEPIAPHSKQVLQNLEHTQILQEHLTARGQDIQHIVSSANRLRFDRPTVTLWESYPQLTVSMLVNFQESIERIAISLRNIKRWATDAMPLQFVLWVYGNTRCDKTELEVYRNRVTATLVSEALGTNIFIRSSVIISDDTNIDHIIDNSLSEQAFAYWKSNINPDEQVFVVNSTNELLRFGTFWEFVRGEHKVPRRSLEKYLRSLSVSERFPFEAITKTEDENALARARLLLATVKSGPQLPANFSKNTQAIAITRRLKRARLTWVQADDLAHTIRFHHKERHKAIIAVDNVVCIPVAYDDDLPSDKYRIAREIITLAKSQNSVPLDCMVVVHGNPEGNWEDIERYRTELMKVVKSQKVAPNVVFSSMIYRRGQAEPAVLFKRRVLAVACYMHWLQNHTQRLSARWQPLEAPMLSQIIDVTGFWLNRHSSSNL